MCNAPRHLALLVLALALAACGGGGGRLGADEPDPPFQPPDGDDQRLNTDPAGAHLSVFPEICGDGNRLYVTWYDRRAGDMDVYFSRSLDDGATWSVEDIRLDTDAPGAAGSSVPRIACDGDRVAVVWSDQRGPYTQIRCNRSLDAGANWLSDDVRIDRESPVNGHSWNPDLCCAGDAVYAVWQDSRNGLSDIYFSRSLDGGQTWEATDRRLDTDAAGVATSEFPRIACSGTTLYVVWQDERDGEPDVRFNTSSDGGVNWLAQDVRLDTDDPGVARSLQPTLACDGSRVGVVWSDDRDGERDVRYNGSIDGGAQWFLSDVRIETDAQGASASLYPALCLEGARVFVAWEDFRASASDVFFSRSDDGGATWLLDDVRLGTDPAGKANAYLPQIRSDGDRVAVAWYDDREGLFDVLLRRSTDGGATWDDEETRLDTDVEGAANSLAPRLWLTPERAHAVWYDQRDGPGDIYANRVAWP